MNSIYMLSLGINLIILTGLLYVLFFGKKHVKDFFLKYILEPRKEQKRTMFQVCPASKGIIIFLGDSITEGGNWSELFPENKILNRGIGGDISSGVLTRIDEIVRHEPTKLFICIGTNDLAMGVQNYTIINNYKTIIDIVKKESPATEIYVQSVFPVRRNVLLTHKNEKIAPLNLEIKQMCTDLEITYIDLYPHFIDSAGYLKKEYTNDNLHLLGNAYLVWRTIIEKYINE